MLLNISSFVDRQVMSLMVDPIKADLGLTDTQVGVILGPAFGLTFAVAVLFMGRVADRINRPAVIAWGVAIWSAMCAASGVASTFGHLFAARVGVGAGEATLSPAAYSLIPDYFPPRRLATAMSVFTSGVFLGAGAAYLVGGVITDLAQSGTPWNLPLVGLIRPWQQVFLVLGVPGLALVLLALTIREPRRGATRDGRKYGRSSFAAWHWFRSHRSAYGWFFISIGLFAVVNYGTGFWFPAYFFRAHGWTPTKVGIVMGLATAGFGTLGALTGGWLADRLKRANRSDGNLWVVIAAAVVSLAASVPLFLPPSDRVMLTALMITNLAAGMPFGPMAAGVAEMTPPAMRGQAAAVLVFVLNFVGLGLGPPAVAVLTDRVFGDPAAVGMSLLAVTVAGRILTAGAAWSGLRGYRVAVAEVVGQAT